MAKMSTSRASATVTKWIKAVKLKKNALHRDMQIPVGKKISKAELLQWRRHLEGELLCSSGVRRKTFATKLKRVNFALSSRSFGKRKKSYSSKGKR